MNLRTRLPRAAACALGLAVSLFAHADTFTTSGNFTADDQVYTYNFSSASTQTFTFSTSSYAAGGFDPVLTLFNAAGAPVDNFGSGTSDAFLSDTLGPGSYILALTEFPNVAIGNYSDGFLFAGNPTITGDICSIAGGQFIDDITCTQRSSAYALSVTSAPVAAATPEPSSWLLVLPGAAVLAFSTRRRRLA